MRGDTQGAGALSINLGDVRNILRFLFKPGSDPAVLPCLDALDVDDDGRVAITDALYLAQYLFQGGALPPEPFPRCGPDPTRDRLGCGAHPACEPGEREFYGIPVEAGAVVFLIERSEALAESGDLAIAKRELLEAIRQMDADTELGIIFFDDGVLSFPGAMPLALAGDRDAQLVAAEFISQTPVGSGACPYAGILEALARLRSSAASAKSIIVLSARLEQCPHGAGLEALEAALADAELAASPEIELHVIGSLAPQS